MSFSNDLVEAKVDTTASGPSLLRQGEVRSFHALREDCALDTNTLFRFRDIFEFPRKSRLVFLKIGKKHVIFRLEKCAL